MAQVTIYHNPKCSKSRQTLSLLEEKNIIPEIILYKETVLNTKQLEDVIRMLGIKARDLIRKSEPEYKDLHLADVSISEEKMIQYMIENPGLIQRPIVIANGQARIGRPPESVLDIL
ncbi:MAG: arsenate reductase (glutaredoxin) [Pseudomonadales bacterium]|nr:arsenate reductase (glutaredoxin) [Pseudomonadales bacterium]